MPNRLLPLMLLLNLATIPVSIWVYHDLYMATLGINLLALLYIYSVQQTNWKKLAEIITGKTRLTWPALLHHIKHEEQFRTDINRLLNHLPQIGTPGFDEQIKLCADEHTRQSFALAHDKIASLKQTEYEHNWITEGVATISQVKLQGDNLNQFAVQVISIVARYLNAYQGAFFKTNTDNTDVALTLLAAYGSREGTQIPKHINAGEGLIGQALFETNLVYLTDIPHNYIKIESGLGKAAPKALCIVPLRYDGTCYGVLELASFEKFPVYHRNYLIKISEIIAYALASGENQQKTQRLLKESRLLTEQMKNNEAVLQSNMEQLTAAQEAMRRKQLEVDAVLAALAALELNMDGVILQANEVFLSLTGFKQEDLVDKHYLEFIPQHGNDRQQYELMWTSICEGKTFSGEFRMTDAHQHPVWMTGNFTPLLNTEGIPYKVMMISMFTTQEKEKLLELQQCVNGIKSIFPMVEVTPELTFKSPNEIFLKTMGIPRAQLRNMTAANLWQQDSCIKLSSCIENDNLNVASVDLVMKENQQSGKTWRANMLKINVPVPKMLLILNHARINDHGEFN